MLKAILVGAATSVALSYASSALHEHMALGGGNQSMWLTVISAPIQTLTTLLPGFITGWLARNRGILAAFLAGVFGNVLYSAVFGTFWDSVLVDGAAGVFSTILWLLLFAVSWGVYSAAAGGTAQLLRSNTDSRDRNGRIVTVGTRVRLVMLPESFLKSLPADETDDVRSMIGEVFKVEEIDQYGHAWVGKGWTNAAGDRYHGHSLALSSKEMEVVDEPAL